jgi:hypothetical protein
VADILLTHSNHLYSDRKQTRKMQPYPPLQTLIAAAQLREAGFSVALFDPALVASPLEDFRAALRAHQPRLVAVVEDNFNFLTKMCLMRNRELAFRMCAAAAEAGLRPMNPKTGDLGDVIIGVNGKRVEALSNFVAELGRSGVDSFVELTVLRDDHERKVRVRVIEVGR